MNHFKFLPGFRAILVTLIVGLPVYLIAEPIRILPLGDSITQGRGGSRGDQYLEYSYRYPLWKMLIDAGVDFDFVGYMQHGFEPQNNGDPDYQDYKGKVFDPDHNGHWGWQTSTILNGSSQSWRKNEEKLSVWLDSFMPDITLILLGTNDGRSSSFNLDATVDNMKEIINQLRANNPHMVILLGLLYQPYEPLPKINQAYIQLATEMTTEESPIATVDHSVGWINDPKAPNADTIDGDHSSVSGDQKLADNWFKALRPYILEGYDGWKFREFENGEAELAQRESDFDVDGYANLMEYALGMNPTEPDGEEKGFRVYWEEGSLSSCFSPVFGLSDVRYIVEGSADGVTWDEVLFDSEVNPVVEDTKFIKTEMAASGTSFARLLIQSSP